MTNEDPALVAESSILAWHFAQENMRLGHGDERLIVPGETLTVTCTPVLCEQGLHASVRAIGALLYASGPMICRVEVSGQVLEDDDKLVGTSRTCLWVVDGTRLLREFAAHHARGALLLAGHPDPRSLAACDVAERYARGEATSAELTAASAAASAAACAAACAAAWAAACAAAWAAAWDAASAAACAAAWDAASAAARDAAWDAASAAARDAAWDAARDAASAAACAAAWDAASAAARDAASAAARDAASAAARDAAWDAARDAAWDAQNEDLERRITEVRHGK